MADTTQPVASTESAPKCRRKLRVCHLAYTFYEEDNRVLRYARAMAERGDHVDVIALRRTGQRRVEESEGVRLFRVQHRSVSERRAWVYLLKILLFFARATLQLTYMHLRHRYDVVHVHNVPDFLVFAATIPKLMGAQVLLDIHDVLPELYAGKFGADDTSLVFRCLLIVERLSCRFSAHVIIANDLWRGKLVRRAVAPDKCTTLINYPDLRLFSPVEKPRDAVDRFVMLYPGSLNHHQGVHVAISAFAMVRAQIPTAEFVIYGEGPAKEQLADLIRTEGVGDRVRLMAPLPLAQIAAVMASADVGVETKLADGFSNEAVSTKVLEFMACGVPVVASRTAAHSHYFCDSHIRFFTSGSAASLAEALLGVFAARDVDHERINRARAFAVNHSWQHRSDDYFTIVDSVGS